MSAADPCLGIAAFLKDDTVINEVTAGRVFRPELPQMEDPHMARACLLVRPAGGGSMYGRGNLQVMDSRLDVICYGSTRLEAENVSRETQRALKNLTLCNFREVKLYWARVSGATASAIDPETNWPFALVSTQVMHSLNTIP